MNEVLGTDGGIGAGASTALFLFFLLMTIGFTSRHGVELSILYSMSIFAFIYLVVKLLGRFSYP